MKTGAKFVVEKIDPEGSGADYGGHLGRIVTDAKRCCTRCTVIFGTVGDNKEFGPFVPGELRALNDEARAIEAEIQVSMRS